MWLRPYTIALISWATAKACFAAFKYASESQGRFDFRNADGFRGGGLDLSTGIVCGMGKRVRLCQPVCHPAMLAVLADSQLAAFRYTTTNFFNSSAALNAAFAAAVSPHSLMKRNAALIWAMSRPVEATTVLTALRRVLLLDLILAT